MIFTSFRRRKFGQRFWQPVWPGWATSHHLGKNLNSFLSTYALLQSNLQHLRKWISESKSVFQWRRQNKDLRSILVARVTRLGNISPFAKKLYSYLPTQWQHSYLYLIKCSVFKKLIIRSKRLPKKAPKWGFKEYFGRYSRNIFPGTFLVTSLECTFRPIGETFRRWRLAAEANLERWTHKLDTNLLSGQVLTTSFAPRGEICSLGECSPLRSPPLFRRMEGRTENFISRE
jgi:hypothetical protein